MGERPHERKELGEFCFLDEEGNQCLRAKVDSKGTTSYVVGLADHKLREIEGRAMYYLVIKQ